MVSHDLIRGVVAALDKSKRGHEDARNLWAFFEDELEKAIEALALHLTYEAWRKQEGLPLFVADTEAAVIERLDATAAAAPAIDYALLERLALHDDMVLQVTAATGSDPARVASRLERIGREIGGIGRDHGSSPESMSVAQSGSPIWDIVRLAEVDRLEAMSAAGEMDVGAAMSEAAAGLDRINIDLEADLVEAHSARAGFETNARRIDKELAKTRTMIEDLIDG